MTADFGLSDNALALLRTIFKQYPQIEKVKIYGSRAKGTFNKYSDIDLVTFGSQINRFVISNVLMDFDDSNIEYVVDLQNYHDLKNAQLIEHIDRIGRVIYSSN